MNVNGNSGTVLLPDPHNPTICPKDSTVNTNYRGGYLTNVLAQDVDVRFRVKTATLAAGDNINVGFDVRRVSGFTSYRGQVRLTPGTNQVWLQGNTLIHNVMTPLGSNSHATLASVATGAYIWVRGQVISTDSTHTTINMKAWNDGSAEPGPWTYTVTDTTPVLQAPGAVGLVGWQSALSTAGPLTVTFDDFNVTSPISGIVPATPVANFTFAQTPGSLDVQFTDTSTGGTPDSWWWDFGDGSNSTSASPLHTYAVEGTYAVKLITTNDGGTTSKSSPVTVDPIAAGTPSASFTSLQDVGTLGVQFTDTSTNTPTSWAWDFGDGQTSASQNPHDNYTAPGAYAVSLMATNGIGTGSTSHSITVVPLPLPGATYITVAPTRLVDSSTGKGGVTHLAANIHQTFQVTGIAPLSIPAGAVAITGNLTVTNQTAPGFFFLGPVAMNAPTSSTLNFPLGDIRANGVTVPLGTGASAGKLSVTYAAKAGNHADMILDITGYFINTAAGSTYVTVTPTRIVDSRAPSPIGLLTHLQANVHQTFNVAGVAPLNIPAEATAVTGNLTVTGQTAAGYFALTPDFNDTPTSSTLNFPAHDTRANNVTVALGPGGTLSVTYAAPAGNHAEVIFDITGYFKPDTTGAVYVPITPTRLADSRFGTGGVSPLTANTGVVFLVANGTSVSASAVAVTGNLTVTGQSAAGFLALTLTAINAPTNSTLNFPKGDTRANGADVPIGPAGKIGITYGATAGNTTQFIFDVTGYFVPSS